MGYATDMRAKGRNEAARPRLLGNQMAAIFKLPHEGQRARRVVGRNPVGDLFQIAQSLPKKARTVHARRGITAAYLAFSLANAASVSSSVSSPLASPSSIRRFNSSVE